MSGLDETQAARVVARSCYGSPLAQQERGFFVCLELLSVLRGHFLSGEELLSPGDEMKDFIRVSHDFARRLAVGSLHRDDEGFESIDLDAREPLQALLKSLTLSIPGQRRAPEWFGCYLYPYVGELVHYDTVRRRNQPALERYSFRGAGILAHEILRTDPNHERVERAQRGLKQLVTNSGTALGKLARALHSHDHVGDSDPWLGEVEQAIAGAALPETKWTELLRRGVANIVDRTETPGAQRIEHLMHWVPYCIARHALEISQEAAGQSCAPIVVDLRSSSNPVRDLSRTDLDRSRWAIVNALLAQAEMIRDSYDAEHPDRKAFNTLLKSRERLIKGPRAFVTETLAAVGALNSTSGRRWFTIHLPLMETFVHALVPEFEEIELDRFILEELCHRLDLVLDGKSAAKRGLVEQVDLAEFDRNAEFAATALRSLGLLTEYSDSTRMVGTGGDR